MPKWKLIWIATAQIWNKSFTHSKHRTEVVVRECLLTKSQTLLSFSFVSLDSSPRSTYLLHYGHITCAHCEEERKNLSDTVTIQYSDQSGTANFAPLQKPHRYRPIQYVFRVGARAIRFCANITLVSMLIDVTALLIFHFHLYSQVEGGRLDRKYAGLQNRLYFFAFFRLAKQVRREPWRAPDTRVFAFLHRYKYNARYYLKSALFVLK